MPKFVFAIVPAEWLAVKVVLKAEEEPTTYAEGNARVPVVAVVEEAVPEEKE